MLTEGVLQLVDVLGFVLIISLYWVFLDGLQKHHQLHTKHKNR